MEWATEPKDMKFSTFNEFYNTYKLVLANTNDIVKNLQDDALEIFYTYDNKVENIKTENTKQDPIVIGVNPKGELSIIDGRHRLKAAYDLGNHYVPVFISKIDYEKFSKKVDVKTHLT